VKSYGFLNMSEALEIKRKIQKKLEEKEVKMPVAIIDFIIKAYLDEIRKKIINHEPMVIKNFGTFSFKKFKGMKRKDGTWFAEPFMQVRFKSCERLKESVKNKIDYFEGYVENDND
jgi:nucleoid DNA-binding protein